jgi:glycosyltransferase involved in cell wall biosynthesis
MKIAQIAPVVESVPPRLYGGTERIVAYLTEELVRQGHDVTLFASGDSITSARLVPVCRQALRLAPGAIDPLPHLMVLLEQVRRRAHLFDVLHFHIDLVQFPLSRTFGGRCLTTLHGRQDLPDLQPFYRTFTDMPLVSISDSQRAPLPAVNWLGTVHHGLPPDLLRPPPRPRGDYLAFLGRMSPEKGPERAIAIARRVGIRLRMAAKVDPVDRAWFETQVRPLLDDPLIEFIGEVDEHGKAAFLGNARALLFPIDWPEPFGLVMIEAMACGTPVIAFRRGSVPEVLEDGITGFLVEDVESAAAAVGRLDRLDRAHIRRQFERRFTAAHMAGTYLQLYRRLLDAARSPRHLALPEAREHHA